jgi:hypothetical protein
MPYLRTTMEQFRTTMMQFGYSPRCRGGDRRARRRFIRWLACACPAAATETGGHRFLERIVSGALADGLGERIAFEGGDQDVAAEGHFGVFGLAGQLLQAAETRVQQIAGGEIVLRFGQVVGGMSCAFWPGSISVWRHSDSDLSPISALGDRARRSGAAVTTRRHHSQPSTLLRAGTPPACTTRPSMTTPGVLITPWRMISGRLSTFSRVIATPFSLAS